MSESANTNILTGLPRALAERHPDRQAIAAVDGSGTVSGALTCGQLARRVEALACALERLGLEPGQTVAVFSQNLPDMVVTDFACFYNRAVPVSVYSTSSPEQVEYIVNDSHAVIAFAGDLRQLGILASLMPKCPTLRHIVLYRGDLPADAPAGSYTIDALVALGEAAPEASRQAVDERRSQSAPADIATLIYTSGTTGEPKGAVLPHRCFNAMIDIHRRRLTMLSEADTSLCFLPLSHIFEKAWTYFCLYSGIHVSVNLNPKEIADTIRHVRPTCMCSVPRFWEKVYAAVTEKMRSMAPPARWMARLAVAAGRRRNLGYLRQGRKAPWWIEIPYRTLDRRVLSRMRRAAGIDRGNIFPTAGAPIAPRIVEFFRSVGVDMVVGYGLSETTATVTCFPGTGYEIGSVGTVMPELQVRTAPNGEIEVKGPTVMDGYLNKPDETRAAFTSDGWLRTGDAGFFDEQGALVLTERLKDLFKTSNGKYVAPQVLESRLGGDRYIEQVAVVGDNRKYVTAIIIPAFEALKDYARRKGITFKSIEELVHNSDILKMISARIERLQKGLPSFEQIKRFTLLPRAFTIESGELTNTLKIRRPVISNHYAREIEAMYT